MAKLKGAPTKLAKHEETSKKKKPSRELMVTKEPRQKRNYNDKGFVPITFHLHRDDMEWLDARVEEWRTRSTASSVTITRLLRLAIRQLREKDLDKLLD